ncbi:MAG: hypothetical protein QXI19_04905 [Candidatus Caldarchaeum sp.]
MAFTCTVSELTFVSTSTLSIAAVRIEEVALMLEFPEEHEAAVTSGSKVNRTRDRDGFLGMKLSHYGCADP